MHSPAQQVPYRLFVHRHDVGNLLEVELVVEAQLNDLQLAGWQFLQPMMQVALLLLAGLGGDLLGLNISHTRPQRPVGRG